jgi:hypothetical protein
MTSYWGNKVAQKFELLQEKGDQISLIKIRPKCNQSNFGKK